MSEIINIGSVYSLSAYTGSSPTSPALRDPVSIVPTEDTVEISRFSRTAFDVNERSSLSLAKARAIRVEIAEGTYETADRIRGTVERILDVIG